MKEEQTDRPAASLSRLEELLEEFLAETAELRERFLFARHQLSSEITQATHQLLEKAESGNLTDLQEISEIPRRAQQQLREGSSLYELWGAEPPPELEIFGNEPGLPDRRRRVLALLRLGIDCPGREEALDVLDRLTEAKDTIPGLGFDFSCWLYLLAPTIFPPLPAKLFLGANEVLAGVVGLKETVRKIWAFADKHALLLETDDLAIPAAFFQWLAQRGAAAWSRPRARRPYYGAELLVNETMLAPSFVDRLVREIRSSKLLLFTGASGTGKTFTALRFARYLVRDGGAYEILKAHPSFGYAELIGRQSNPGILLQLLLSAARDPAGQYVLFIDGIDKLDAELLLGELMLALEYPEEQITTAPGFRISFPPNLFLLVTARRPWEELLQEQYGFFRLFSHARFSPDPLKLAEYFNRNGNPIKQLDVVHCFRKLNRLLQERVGGQVQVGHGYLMVEGLNDGNLAAFWDTYIIPYIRSQVQDAKVDFEAFRLARLT